MCFFSLSKVGLVVKIDTFLSIQDFSVCVYVKAYLFFSLCSYWQFSGIVCDLRDTPKVSQKLFLSNPNL